MKDCPMCGNEAKHLVARWYKYDNGEQYIEWVCKTCALRHDQMVGKKK